MMMMIGVLPTAHPASGGTPLGCDSKPNTQRCTCLRRKMSKLLCAAFQRGAKKVSQCRPQQGRFFCALRSGSCAKVLERKVSKPSWNLQANSPLSSYTFHRHSAESNEAPYLVQALVASGIAFGFVNSMLQDSGEKTNRFVAADAKDLKTYTRSEVSQHKDAKDGIWITFKNGVYDITDFVEQHPGGANKIMLAAGGAVDPFWNLYQQHFDGKVQDILRKYQIGVLSEKEEKIEYDSSDPYANDPTRHSALVVHKQKPFNAETPTQLISEESYITPNALWYVRHHHPVPVVDAKEYRLVFFLMTVLHVSFA